MGDVSGHRMCGSCRLKCMGACPFCRDITIKDGILEFLNDFIDSVTRRTSRGSSNTARDEMAEVIEHWQAFELEYGAQPRVVRRVARLMVEDAGFASRLET